MKVDYDNETKQKVLDSTKIIFKHLNDIYLSVYDVCDYVAIKNFLDVVEKDFKIEDKK